jgi:hypothetical protein
MKTTQNKETLELVDNLHWYIEKRKELEREERRLKSRLYDLLDGSSSLKAGDYLVVVSERERCDINKEKVKSILGNKYEEVVEVKHYKIMEVKAA